MREGWEYKKLGEVCSPKKEIKRATKVFAPNDTIKYIDISSIDNSTQRMTSCSNYIMSAAPSRAQQCVIKGDIIVSTVRPNLKNIATVDSNDNNLVASSGFCVLRPFNIERNYMFHYIKSDKFTNHLMGLTTGANYPAVRDSDILDSIIPVPPLATQLSIVSELDKINELIRLKKEQLSDYDKLAQSLFYEMFGDPVENEKGWEFNSLSNLCDVFAGGDKPSDLSNIQSKEFPYPVIANGDGNKGILGYSKICKVKEDAVTIGARGASIGNCRLVRNGFTPAIRLITLVPQGMLNCYYLYYYVKNMNYRVNGVAQAQLTVPNIKGEIIPLPPLALQNLFAQRIELIEQQKAEIKSTITDLETLLASRMQYWFD